MTYKKISLEIDLFNRNFEIIRKSDSLLGQIQTVSVIHGGGMLYESKETKKHHRTQMHKLSTSLNLNSEIISNYKMDEFCIFMNEFINQQIQESSKMILDETSAISEFTGNVFDKKGSKFNYDDFLEIIEKMDISFDKEGSPNLPTIFCGSNFFDNFSKIKVNDRQKLKLNQIIQSKKEKWYANKYYRKLSFIN